MRNASFSRIRNQLKRNNNRTPYMAASMCHLIRNVGKKHKTQLLNHAFKTGPMVAGSFHRHEKTSTNFVVLRPSTKGFLQICAESA